MSEELQDLDRILKLQDEYVVRFRALQDRSDTDKRNLLLNAMLFLVGAIFTVAFYFYSQEKFTVITQRFGFNEVEINVPPYIYLLLLVAFVSLTTLTIYSYYRFLHRRRIYKREISVLIKQLKSLVRLTSQMLAHSDYTELRQLEIRLKLDEAEELIAINKDTFAKYAYEEKSVDSAFLPKQRDVI